MSLAILLIDELRGYVKSKITIILFIILPVLAVLMSFLTGQLENFPATYLTTVLATSIAGALGSIMLSTSITSEQNKNVYDLFLIRPVKRRNIILAKFFAVYLCTIAAVWISIFTGMIIDALRDITVPQFFVDQLIDSVLTVFFALAITCSFGALFGILMKSVAGSALLSLYVGNQASSILTLVLPLISQMMELEFGIPFPFDPFILTIIIGTATSIIILLLAIVVFNKKQF
jgi:ABC-type transport system involved in multi-copper enzyme maturation permease subunit